MHRIANLLLIALCLAPLNACAAPRTYADVQATAQIAGCWPDRYPTPRAVTVTPSGSGGGYAASTAATPRVTALPTTTPYPRCPAPPGATLAPWPTPVPNPPPYPTIEPRRWQGGSDRVLTMHLPGTIYGLDLAVHPSAGWPVVGVIQRAWGTPIQAFVRVYDPRSQNWGVAQQVDVGAASSGNDPFGSIAVGVTGDGTVYAAWGASDRRVDDQGRWTTTPDLWVSTSADYGATWAPPRRIATNCWNVQDLATSADGFVVVLGNCFRRAGASYAGQTTLIVKRPGGDWLPPARLDGPAASGAVVIVGRGDAARAVALTTAFDDPHRRRLALLSRRLAGDGAWSVAIRPFDLPRDESLNDPTAGAAWHIRGLVFPCHLPDGRVQDSVIFTWATYGRVALCALTSLDGGATWEPIETIQSRTGPPGRVGPQEFVTPAYDPVADRLVVIWTCCGAEQGSSAPNTHFAGWSRPGSGIWEHWPHALALGARSADASATAQAPGSRMAWLAWVEQRQQVLVRTVDLNTIIPADAYPTATPTPASRAASPGGA